MIQASIYDVKTHLSHYVRIALSGEKVIIAKRNKPLVELKPLAKKKGKRILGQSKGKIMLTEAFFEPLPDEMIQAFANPK